MSFYWRYISFCLYIAEAVLDIDLFFQYLTLSESMIKASVAFSMKKIDIMLCDIFRV